jgi:hypothetical protein
MSASNNTIAVLLILALVFAGIGVGIAINNYQDVNAAAYKEINVEPAQPVSGDVQVGVSVKEPVDEGST